MSWLDGKNIHYREENVIVNIKKKKFIEKKNSLIWMSWYWKEHRGHKITDCSQVIKCNLCINDVIIRQIKKKKKR